MPKELLKDIKKGSKEGNLIIDLHKDLSFIGDYIDNSEVRR